MCGVIAILYVDNLTNSNTMILSINRVESVNQVCNN